MKRFLLSLGVILLFIVGLILGIMIQRQLDTKEPKDVVKCPEKECLANVIYFNINDGMIPGSSYEFNLNLETKDVYVKVDHWCSYEGCNPTKTQGKGTLNDDEFAKAMKVIKKIDINDNDKQLKLKAAFASAIEKIAQGDAVFATKENSPNDFDSNYKMYDVDNNGIVTCKEFGDKYLDDIVKDIESDESIYLPQGA